MGVTCDKLNAIIVSIKDNTIVIEQEFTKQTQRINYVKECCPKRVSITPMYVTL